MSPRAVVVGPPGAGKTTVGQLLARRLEVPFRDTDSDVEAVAGMTVADLFIEKGEAHFRELERAAVAAALTEFDGVLALGGGAVLDAGTRAALVASPAPVVLLVVGIEDAAARVGFNQARPLLLGNPRQQWQRLLEQRKGFYEEVATMTVPTDKRAPAHVADEIAARLADAQ
ncbi:shikimate kinase [Motilibacter deserti]|uniref:Shikimate kinase n=1 Tax=Motilibacter deserti TaxID=2714956 RepID=A0ABX0GV45_9ACTN|nr:shikimate kinase [Motilibacter deserti]NHC14016.1 shikimate kinase [Motilibacter deserti]